jgi:hypothetical protein
MYVNKAYTFHHLLQSYMWTYVPFMHFSIQMCSHPMFQWVNTRYGASHFVSQYNFLQGVTNKDAIKI